MRYFIFPTQDASIYQELPNINTGLDEILEVGKTNEGVQSVRSLIQFYIPNDLPFSASYDLVLQVANAESLNVGQFIQVAPVSASWVEGSGYYYQNLYNEGNGVIWTGYSASLDPTLSGSLSGSTLTIDVSTIIRTWLSGSINNGLMIKFPTSDESDIRNIGNIKFFSNQTHTIYKPTLVAKWDDQVYVTGSSCPTGSLVVSPSVKKEYSQGEVTRVDVNFRERYPVKTFENVATRWSQSRILPQTSYFSIVDDLSGTVIIPFSEESKISSDGTVNYFILRIQHMYPRRYYRILVKVVHDDQEEIFDNNHIFTVK